MKRKYGQSEGESCLRKIAQISFEGRPAFVGIDLIAGFPGESEEEFKRGMDLLASLPWQRLHVFPYSERKGTPATRLPGSVLRQIRAQRAAQLRELSIGRLKNHYEKYKPTCLNQILVEGPCRGPDGSKDGISGYTPDYLRVIMRREGLTRNTMLEARVEGVAIDSMNQDVYFLARRESNQLSNLGIATPAP